MYTATRNGPSTSAPGDGSRTLTITNNQIQEGDEQGDNSEGSHIIGTLSLRTAQRRTGPRVAWGEDVVDNEGFGKKKSKICCIYHKPRRFDESSDESSSDSDSGSSCPHEHDHSGHNHHRHRPNPSPSPRSSNPQQAQRNPGVVHEPELLDDTEPNAYEKQPESKKGKSRAT